MIDLNPHQLDTVLSILKAHVPDDTVLAFGSRVKWTATEFSDLDLVICGSKAHDFLTLGRLKEALDDSDLPIRVDVHDWNGIPDYFKPNIEGAFEVLVQGTSRFPPVSNDSGRSLGDVARIVMGQSPPGETVTAIGETPLLNGPTDFGSNHPVPTQYTFDGRRFAEKGDLLFCVRGSTTGRMNWADQRYAIGRGVAALRQMRDPALQPLLRAVVSLALPGLLAEATGSTFPNVSRDQLAKLSWPSLSPAVEQQVARILGTLDDRIELSRRMSETLEALAQALFKSWFVDFDPVRAKAEGRPSGLPPDLDTLFPAAFEESELGKIPSGWSVRPLRDLVEQLRDSDDPMSSPDTTFEHYSIPAFDQDQLPRQEHGKNVKSRKFKVPSRAVLVSRLNPEVERVWLVVVEGDEKAICSTEFLVLQSQPPVTDSFVYCLARSRSFREIMKSLVTGTSNSHQQARVDAVLSLGVISPSATILREFDCRTRAILDLSLNYRRASRNIAEQRDALLPRLISGELRMGAAE